MDFSLFLKSGLQTTDHYLLSSRVIKTKDQPEVKLNPSIQL